MIQITTDPTGLKDLSGDENTETVVAKAKDIYVGKYNGKWEWTFILFLPIWPKYQVTEVRIVGKILRNESEDGRTRVVAYEPQFLNSLQIQKANGEPLEILVLTPEHRLVNYFFSWNPINRRWDPA